MTKRGRLSERIKEWAKSSPRGQRPLIATLRTKKSYEAEEGLFAILGHYLTEEDWEDGLNPPHRLLPPFKNTSAARHVPATMPYRRLRMHGTGSCGPPPYCAKLFRVIEDYVDLGIGFERSDSLGPVLNAERLRLWKEWAARFDQSRIDPCGSIEANGETGEREVRLAELLLRRGFFPDRTGLPDLLPSQRMETGLTKGQAITCVARYSFSRALRAVSGNVAVMEVLNWAASNWKITKAHETRIMKQLVAIWNDVVEPCGLSSRDLGLLRRVFPRTDAATFRRRQAALRLLGRVKAQAIAWNSDLVSVPTTWFRRAKDEADPRSIVGVSSGTYLRDLLDPLESAGILERVADGSHKAADRQCAIYRLSGIDLNGKAIPLGEAEALLLQG